jgi:hypothetical protein
LYNIKVINANANYRGYPKSNHYPSLLTPPCSFH